MSAVAMPARKRCAVYARKSTDEGLDQEYNSIDAQRDAGQAFIVSQRAEGWIPVADDYDDPAFSGGNMDRPALKRLLADIEKGRIDVVVVYKIDRLTRSLADFSKIIEVFERHGASFVSVTQQFNTTTSMGRLMLNILLSFAQFEREVTGERMRDKIAASKRKGLWMGGHPPLGYDVKNRLLVVNEAEARVVRRIFEAFVDLRSSTEIARQLTAEGIGTKSWTTRDGRHNPGARIDKKSTRCSETASPRRNLPQGELVPWPARADRRPRLWGRVHEILSEDAHERAGATQIRRRTDALLRGLLHAPSGERMYPTFTRKNGRQYRYYVSKSELRFGAAAKTYERIPADEVEAVAVAQIKSVLASPEAIAAVCRVIKRQGAAVDEAQVVLSR